MNIVKRIAKKVNVISYPEKLFYAPEWIVLGVNNICNLHCKMCDVGTGYKNSNFYYNLMGAQPVNMPLELIKQIIDQTALYFPKAKLGYAFTEPIIYPYLVESLEYAKTKGLYTTMSTNGLKLPKLAEDFRKAGLDEIFISLDGPPAIHNQIRGYKHSFELAYEGMQKIAAMKGKKPLMSVFCTITEWNIGSLVKFVNLFKDIPLRKLGFMHTNYTTSNLADQHNHIYGMSYPATASNMEEINLDAMDLDLLKDEINILDLAKHPFPVAFSPSLKSKEELHRFYHMPEKKIGKICNDVFRNIMIKSDGTVIPAHGRCYKVEAGNLYENNLKEIWNSQTLADFRKVLMKAGGLLPACSRCCSAF